jgi:hypothetical protein
MIHALEVTRNAVALATNNGFVAWVEAGGSLFVRTLDTPPVVVATGLVNARAIAIGTHGLYIATADGLDFVPLQ